MPVPDRLVAAVADAGPLIHLDELHALPLLAEFTEVLVPAVVSTEVSRHRSGWTDRAPSCLREADPNPQTLRALKEEAMSADLDPGEISALALWCENPDFVLLCDEYGEEATRFLVEQRRVGALGVDTASIDYGQSKDFIAHQIAAGGGVPNLENVARVDELPETGFWVIALPVKIGKGSGGPVRIVAVVP